jgi:hypothetical protein
VNSLDGVAATCVAAASHAAGCADDGRLVREVTPCRRIVRPEPPRGLEPRSPHYERGVLACRTPAAVKGSENHVLEAGPVPLYQLSYRSEARLGLEPRTCRLTVEVTRFIRIAARPDGRSRTSAVWSQTTRAPATPRPVARRRVSDVASFVVWHHCGVIKELRTPLPFRACGSTVGRFRTLIARVGAGHPGRLDDHRSRRRTWRRYAS